MHKLRQDKIRHLLSRISKASREELRFRGEQFAWNRFEVLRHQLGFHPRSLSLETDGTLATTGKFFFSPAELGAMTQAIKTKLPDVDLETVQRAERICSHCFDLLGYRGLDFDKKIDWHFDPVSKKHSPRKYFYRVPYLNPEVVGDSKVIWELNRHQHFVVLGKAYQYTGNEKYFDEFVTQFYHWQEQNPYLLGINWTSSLEVAFRTLSWLWARELFSTSGNFTKALDRDLIAAVTRNCNFIEHNLSTYFSRNTHLLGEAAALFFVGVLFSQFEDAEKWKTLGWDIIQKEAEHQVLLDGGYFEQATYYHVYALDLLLHTRIMAERNGFPIPKQFEQIIIRMLDYLAALNNPGPVVRFGDDDGGRLFDPQRNRREHLADPLSVGAVLFQRADWKALSNGLTEETIWLFGADAIGRFEAIETNYRQPSSRALTGSGLYLMVDEKLRLAVDAGPFGAGNFGHAHADSLSVTLAIEGHEYVCDRGTFNYSGPGRDFFRSTAAHNTMRIDDSDQAATVTPFKWQNVPEVRVDHWSSGAHFDFLVARHSGYERLGVTHRRMILFVKPKFWTVIDLVDGAGDHQLELLWHIKPGAASLTNTAVEVKGPNDTKLGMIAVSDPQWTSEVVATWHSQLYGQQESALALRCSTFTSLPASFATLFVPWFTDARQLKRLQPVGQAAKIQGFCWEHQAQRHFWILSEAERTWTFHGFEGDARFAYCTLDDQGILSQAFLWKGSFLAFNGVRQMSLLHPQEQVEFRRPHQSWTARPEVDNSVQSRATLSIL